MDIKFNNLRIVTVAKVGSTDFTLSCKNKYKTTHRHSLLYLREILEKEKDTLIIVGIRNPIDRNLSAFFQHFRDRRNNDLQTKKNNYKGEYGFTPISLKTDTKTIIEWYFKKDIHNTFNDWFEEFFEITNIYDKGFNKDKGLDFYEQPNNNTIMIYTIEKLDSNNAEICKILDIPKLGYTNKGELRDYKDIYINVKKEITYKKEYLDKLLDTNIMKFFYNQSDIDEMYSKYKIQE